MRESAIEKKVSEYAKSKGFFAYKFRSPMNRGVPDRIFITENGFIFFIEFKATGKKPTLLQQKMCEGLAKRKVYVYIIDDVDIGKQLIDKIVIGDKIE